MRLALLGLAASFATLPLVGQELRLSQSPVTITASFVRAGTPKDPVDRPYDTDVNVTTPSETVSYSNKMVIRAALDATPSLGTTEALTGWSLVAVWANWPDVGNSYKFFLRKSGRDPVAVPDTVLKLELTDPYAAQKLTRRSGNIVTGSDTHKALALVTLGGLGTSDDSRRDTPSGSADGVMFGTGKYERPAGASTAVYRPQSDLFVGYGDTDSESDYNTITVKIRIGASVGVAASKFTPTPTEPSAGPAAVSIVVPTSTGSTGLVKVGSGSLSLSSGSVSTFSGSTTVSGGAITIVNSGNSGSSESTSEGSVAGTINIGNYTVTLNGSALTFSGVTISGSIVNSALVDSANTSASADTTTLGSAL